MPPAKLTVTGVGPKTAFEIDRETVIGRSMRADLQIDGDLVSRQHARIFEADGAWHVEDLGSRNGSLLNKQPINAPRKLRSGDVIMIGNAAILFETTHPASSSFQVSIIDAAADFASATIADADDQSGMATVALSYADLVMLNERITTIVRISQKLATLLDRDQLLGEVLERLLEHFPQAHRGAVVLKDAAGIFQVVATKQRDGQSAGSEMRISTALIRFVRRERKAVLSADTALDARFAGSESIVCTGGRSIMCAPLQHQDDFLGVIYLDTESLRSPFKHADLNLLQGIAGPVAMFVQNTLLVRQIEHETEMRTSLSRYLSPDVVRQIGDGQLTANLGGEQVEGTVMFSDIVGFTAMSEQLTPTEVVTRLNEYFTSMLQAIFGWDGTVDKFGGDAVLAVWGAPMPMDEHALMATAAALDMQARLFELNLTLEDAGETRIEMAVGLNTGRFVAGNIGGEERIEWTVIGDAVNLAQRVESQGFPGCVLASSTTVAGLGGAGGGSVFPPVHVKNRAEPVTIHSVRALRTSQGIVAALPVTVSVEGGAPLPGIVVGVPSAEPLRLALSVAGDVAPRARVRLTAHMPEGPPLVANGLVASRAPLQLAPRGCSAVVVIEQLDPALGTMLRAEGYVPASRALAEIDR